MGAVGGDIAECKASHINLRDRIKEHISILKRLLVEFDYKFYDIMFCQQSNDENIQWSRSIKLYQKALRPALQLGQPEHFYRFQAKVKRDYARQKQR